MSKGVPGCLNFGDVASSKVIIKIFKIMIKKYVMVMAMMMVSVIIFAQRHGGDPQAAAAKRSEKMKTELSLTDDQYTRVKELNDKAAVQQAALRNDSSLSKSEKMTRMKQLRADHDTQLKSILSEEQWTRWTAIRSERGGKRKRSGGAAAPESDQ